MIKIPKLSASSHRILAMEMTSRAAVAGPLHALFFAWFLYRTEALRTETVSWFLFSLIIFSAVGRIWLNRVTERWLANRRLRAVWRWSFAIFSLMLAIAWSGSAVLVTQKMGLGEQSMHLQIAVFGICALAIPAFAYDLKILMAFLQVMILPLAFAVSQNAIGYLLFDLFISYVAIHMHRSAINSMHQIETISGLHNTLHTMMNSLDEAFLTIGRDGKFGPTDSARAADLFGVNPSGQHLTEVLRASEKQKEEIDVWLDVAFAGQVDFETVAGLGPARFERDGQIVSLRYKPMGGGVSSAIVMVAADISREVEAQRAAERNLARAEMILEALKDPTGFQEFLDDTETLFAHMRTDSAEVRRELHNLKAAAGMMRIPPLVQAVHACERALRAGSPITDERIKLQQFMESWLEQEGDLISRLRPKAALAPRTLEAYLNTLASAAETASEKLGKPALLKVSQKGPPFWVPEPTPAYLKTFVHLINNAVDHGLEDAETRVARNKPAVGTIHFCAEASDVELRILVADDGGGINRDALRKSLIKKGFPTPAIEADLLDLIFEDQISSREKATEISGHGVGMAAVRATLREAGGDIRILKSDIQGTTFEIRVPIANKALRSA